MNRVTMIMAVCAMMMGFAACDNASYLSANMQEIESNQEASEGVLTLSSDGKKFEIAHSPEWITVNLADSVLSYNIVANDTHEVRSDSIVVTCGGMSLCIPVTQNVKATYLKVDQESVSFEKEGGSQTVAIDTDGGNITTEVTGDITASVEGKTLSISAAANDGGSKSGEVTVKCDEFSAKVKVTVKGSMCARCKGTGKIKCPACGGSGSQFVSSGGECGPIGCNRCGGRLVMRGGGPRGVDLYSDGTGRINCPDCKGAGR